MGTTRFGFLGVGDMGRPMAMRLADQGLTLTVHDPSARAIAPFVERGVAVAATVAELAAECDVILACLPQPSICRSVAAELGAVQNRRTTVYAEMSTVGSAVVRDIATALAAAGVSVIDSPISGGPAVAARGELTCIVSGPSAAVDRARAAYDALGRNFFFLGEEPGLAQAMKVGNNLLAATNLAATSEVVRMLEAAGIAPRTAIDVINVSTGRNRASELLFPTRILTGTFDQGARLEILAKDTDLAIAEARRWRTDLTIGGAVRDVWAEAERAGLGGQDITRIYDWAGRTSDTEAER